jgi:ribokinase
MAIVCVGSINIDHVYRVDRFARPGETLLTDDHAAGLGGKGANQSIAAARAGAVVRHVGAVGADGAWTVARLADEGIDVTGIATVDAVTGHAVIQVDAAGENLILVHSGANTALTRDAIEAAVGAMAPEDWLLFQNETNLTADIAEIGRAAGVRVAYSAAPFVAETALPLLGAVDLICVNALEASTLAEHFSGDVDAIPVEKLLITRGAAGAEYRDGDARWRVPAYPVTPVDTTGAGDTFLGFFLAALDAGLDGEAALRRASAASAIQVTRPGAADAIPTAAEVDGFMSAEAGA